MIAITCAQHRNSPRSTEYLFGGVRRARVANFWELNSICNHGLSKARRHPLDAMDAQDGVNGVVSQPSLKESCRNFMVARVRNMWLRVRPALANFGTTWVGFDPMWPSWEQNWPEFGRTRPDSAETEPDLAATRNIGRNGGKFANQFRPKCGEKCGRIRPPHQLWSLQKAPKVSQMSTQYRALF